MKTILILQEKLKFEFNYMANVNQSTPTNLFMKGQKECAQHATQIIAMLMAEVAIMEEKLNKKS